MKRRGNAIIIAMLMIAAVGGIAFGVGRLTMVDTSNLATYENGVGAFYAAEAGAEEGLLRYKFDRNYSVPFDSWTVGDSKIFKTDLTASTSDNGDPAGSAPTTAAKADDQNYDLRMGYLGPFNGTYATSTGDFVPVNRDDETKIDLSGFNFSGNDVNLDINFTLPSLTVPNECEAMAELKLTVDDGVNVNEYKELLNYDPTTCQFYPPNLAPEKLLKADSGTTDIPNTKFDVKLTSVYSKITSRAGVTFTAGAKIELSIKPLYYSAGIKVYPSAACSGCDLNGAVPGPFTTITSIGYYGGVMRKVVTNVDRNSGTVYDLFNYVIYKGS